MTSNKSTPSDTPKILIVDDDAGQRSLLDSFLKSQGFNTVIASSGEQALAILGSSEVQMMISDVRMTGMTGLETLRQARQSRQTLPVLLVTAYPDIRDAVGAMRDGAVNYLEKPINLDELLAIVRKATGKVTESAPRFAAGQSLPPRVIAKSPLMLAVFRDASLVAPSDSRILITGESGVGKEVVADVIHAWSPRAACPIVKVNCAAIPENLLESELFGHEKGAFTGAVSQRIGRFEEAGKGTLLLDEIAELSPSLQAKLLRVTQDGVFQRVGSNANRATQVRILAATNRNLEKEVESGRFREDLFYRLNVMEIHIPALRERPEDILPMASQFMAEFSDRRARFSPAVAGCLEQYKWPGNVRELRNAMERAAMLCPGETIMPEHLPARIRQTESDTVAPPASADSRLENIERHAILQALRECNYNRTETARALGISRRALLYKLGHLRELGFAIDSDQPGASNNPETAS